MSQRDKFNRLFRDFGDYRDWRDHEKPYVRMLAQCLNVKPKVIPYYPEITEASLEGLKVNYDVIERRAPVYNLRDHLELLRRFHTEEFRYIAAAMEGMGTLDYDKIGRKPLSARRIWVVTVTKLRKEYCSQPEISKLFYAATGTIYGAQDDDYAGAVRTHATAFAWHDLPRRIAGTVSPIVNKLKAIDISLYIYDPLRDRKIALPPCDYDKTEFETHPLRLYL